MCMYIYIHIMLYTSVLMQSGCGWGLAHLVALGFRV